MERYYKVSCNGVITVLIGILSTSIAKQAMADDVPAGSDMFITPDFGATFVDLGDPDATPIPAGFFGPGSDPFTGIITLKGVPLVCSLDCKGADTIVERLADAAVLPGGSDSIPIQMRALHLESTAPITVNFSSGGPSTYDVEVFLSEVCPQQIGTMTLNHEFPDGGTFTSQLPVTAKLVFTKVGGAQGLSTATLDPPNCSRTDDFSVTPASPGNWSHVVPPGMTIHSVPAGDADHDGDGFIVESGSDFPATIVNFHVGICPTGGECDQGQKLTLEEAQWAAHGVEPLNDPPPPPNFGACCDHAAPGGVCVSDAAPQDCVGGQKQFFKDETCASIEAAGLCEMSAAPPQFFFDALPELPGGASEVFAITGDWDNDPIDSIGLSVGRAQDGDGIWKAVVWTREAGQPWEIEVLPNPFGNTESAAFASDAGVDMADVFFGGSANTPGRVCAGGPNAGDPCTSNTECVPSTCLPGPDPMPQPVFWTGNGAGPWEAVVPPLPPGFNSGAFLATDAGDGLNSDTVRFSGWLSPNGGDERHAVYCDMTSDGGGWTSAWSLLPDNGPGFPSEALTITHDNIFIDDVHIGGASATDSSPQAPCVWQSLPGGGFERTDLPMTPGAYLGTITAFPSDPSNDATGDFAVGHNASIAGLADLYRGVLYRRIDGVWGAPLQLPPLPGMRDSRAVSLGDTGTHEVGHWMGGYSYMELSPDSERATLWHVGPDDTITVFDLNDLTVNLPPDVSLLISDEVHGGVPGFLSAGSFANADTPSVPHGHVLIQLCGTDCNKNGEDDCIDLVWWATSRDANGNGIPDECEAPPAAVPDPSEKTRAISFSTAPPAVATGAAAPQTAIRVTAVDLQHPIPPNPPNRAQPNFTAFDTTLNNMCTGPGPYSGYYCQSGADCPGSGTCPAGIGCAAPGEMNGCARWVGPPFTYLESRDSPGLGNYSAARLQCTAYYHDWGSEGIVHVLGSEIVPSSRYDVEVFAALCKGAEGTCQAVSFPVSIATRRAGDVFAPFNPPDSSPQPEGPDVAAVVNKFKNLPGSIVKAIAQVQSNFPIPTNDVDGTDIAVVVDAVKGFAYGFSGPCICPSTVPCDTTVCSSNGQCANAPGNYGAGAQCVRECQSGPRAGEPCTESVGNPPIPDLDCGACSAGSPNPGIPCDANSDCSPGTCATGVCGAGGPATTGFCRDRCGRCD